MTVATLTPSGGASAPRSVEASGLIFGVRFGMAKNKNDKSNSTTVVPTVRPDDPAPSAASPATTDRPTGSGDNAPVHRGSAPESVVGGVVAQVGEVATASIRVTKRLLPGRTPAYLGAGALLVAGIIEPPALLAGGLAYEALRRWNPPTS